MAVRHPRHPRTVTDKSRPDGGWAARLQFRQLPDDATDFERRIHELNVHQLPGPGWIPIVEELHGKLVELDLDYVLDQVKEKFGTLRVYVITAPEVADQARDLVDAAQIRSATICEGCGAPGELRETHDWVMTLCDACNAAHEPGRPLPNDWPVT